MAAFTPIVDGTVSIAATTASASVALTKLANPQYEVYNDGPDTVFVMFGLSGLTLTAATNYAVPAYQSRLLSVDTKATTAYARTVSGTATVYFMPGAGE
jgi:hypothetical protein